MSTDGKTFREAYALLQKHAQALRSEQEPDIDNLTTIVRESLDAYQVCKARIDAVEKALEASLGETGRETDGGPRELQLPHGATAEPGAAEAVADDDDIPF